MRTRLDRWLPRAAAGALVAAIVAVVLVVTLSGHEQPSAAGSLPRGQAFSATWSLSPSSHLFGDTVHMRVEATVDRRRLDPRLLRLEAPLKPYEQIGPRRRTQRDLGHYTQVVYRIDLRCVSSDCVASIGAIRRLHLEPARLVYRGQPPPGGVKPIKYTWPVILAFSRLDPADLAARARGVTPFGQNPNRISKQPLPPWHVDVSLAPVSYSVRPDNAFWVAIAGALLLVGAAGLLLRPYLPAATFLRRHRREPGPLERALAAVESARASGPQERERKALELLGTELVRSGDVQLAEHARALAWSRPAPPEPALTTALALDVRKLIEQRSNGQGA